MARKTGLTKDTLHHMILDAGVIYLDYGKPTQRKLGCTRGGSEFSVEGERRDMPFDGISGIVKGAVRYLSTKATLSTNLVEISKEIIQMTIPGSTVSAAIPAKDEGAVAITGENQYEISRKFTSTIPNLPFYDIALVAEVSNLKTPVVCILKNSVSDGKFNISVKDGDEAVLAVTFQATVDPEDPDDEGWTIIWPEKLPVA